MAHIQEMIRLDGNVENRRLECYPNPDFKSYNGFSDIFAPLHSQSISLCCLLLCLLLVRRILCDTQCSGHRGSSTAGTLILHLAPGDLWSFSQLAQAGVMPGAVGKCIPFQGIKAGWFLSSLLKFWTHQNAQFSKTKDLLADMSFKLRNAT